LLLGSRGDFDAPAPDSKPMVARLDPRVFFRIDRRQLVNLERIVAVRPGKDGRLLVRLDGGVEVTLSRRRAQQFRLLREL
jgi:two-component system LytT family response regulator